MDPGSSIHLDVGNVRTKPQITKTALLIFNVSGWNKSSLTPKFGLDISNTKNKSGL